MGAEHVSKLLSTTAWGTTTGGGHKGPEDTEVSAWAAGSYQPQRRGTGSRHRDARGEAQDQQNRDPPRGQPRINILWDPEDVKPTEKN